MSSKSRCWFGLALAFLSLGVAQGCGHWKPAQTYQVESRADSMATYGAVQQVLAAHRYHVIQRDDSNRRIVVVAHANEETPDRQSFITLQTTPDAKVQLWPSGYLVRSDRSPNTVHNRLTAELESLRRALDQQLRVPVSGYPSAPASTPSSGAPMAWNESIYDPATFGPVDFTCLPVRIPAEEQQFMKIKLSTGEEADVALSLAYAPELCRSPGQCTAPGGCPALGMGDAEQVARLAQRLVRKEVDRSAVLLHRGQPVVALDLARHGVIAKAMAQAKQGGPAPASSSDKGGW